MERVFDLRQDSKRADDLESEEKAIASLTAQEYDSLRVLASLPEHSDLYKFKFQQYKQLSEARHRAEALLQEQRLRRLQQNLHLQAADAERQMRQDEWLEQQKRRLLVAEFTSLPGPQRQEQIQQAIVE